VREMNTIIDIGLPDISEEAIEQLAEDCEAHVVEFIQSQISEKSIESLFISCSLDLVNGQLDVEIDIDISQSYDTGHNLDYIIQQASDYGVDWLEKRLMEMKNR